MATWVWIVIAVAAVVVVALLLWSALRTRRTRTLKEGFGPEYDRTVADAPSRREAEAELAERRKRREDLDIRPLDPDARERYADEWQATQARFVDDPGGAITEADVLIQRVMRERGYPVEDFEQRAADVSVDHPEVVNNYRAAHAAATARPATISALPSGRRRIVSTATPTAASVPRPFPRIASSRAGKRSRWSCAGGIPEPAKEPVTGTAIATPTASPAYARPTAPARRTPARRSDPTPRSGAVRS